MRNNILQLVAIVSLLTLAACGGSTTEYQIKNGQTPAPIATNEFIAMAKTANCAEFKNRLLVIDQKYVLWDKAGSCSDASYSRSLYGNTTQNLLCSHVDSIAGPRFHCQDVSASQLFRTIVDNIDQTDLGLGKQHSVQALTIPEPLLTVLPIKVLSIPFYTSLDIDWLLIKDKAGWDQFWRAFTVKPAASQLVPDFNASMTLTTFYKTANSCSITRFLKLTSDGQQVRANFFREDRIALEKCNNDAAFSTPMQMIELPKILLPIDLKNVSANLIQDNAIATGENSDIEIAQQLVIRDQASWHQLWKQHANSASPIVDFNKKMIIAVFLGERNSGCSGLQDVRVWRDSHAINVSFFVRQAGPLDLCTANITRPYYISEIDRSSDTVEFNQVIVPAH
ncbi:hypothetical protein [Undibacterium fentianense]|uniref:Lipoprotein n=1 Tax=Undibacterium fentianense TaxID=2828728 RepID=A0A941ICY8_9BURK|nr:hypothetical protein [Undibacterium fentianense]MBR7799383.1 hypothetical protein [Undibacterium fentianense]